MLLTINEFQVLLSSITCLHSYPISSVQFSSVAQLCLTLCDPMNHSTPGIPVHHPTHREKVFALLFPTHCIHASYNQQMILKTPILLLCPGSKDGLRTPVQRWLSPELAGCSNSISHFNKLYFPLILSRVWKFFSNPHMDHDIKDMGNPVS